jgi:hypothetical protein
MFKDKRYDEKLTHIICEFATHPDHISSKIINESVVDLPDGTRAICVTIETTLQSFEIENWNKRIYGGELVMDSIDNDGMIQNDIKQGQWIGEFGHPLDLEVRRQMILNPPTASHRIMKYWRAGNLLKAHVRSLPYGNGLAMAANCRDDVPAAFSLRALGGVDMTTRRAKRPLKVITYDYVYRPSHIEAYQDRVINESVQMTNSGIYIPTKYDINDIMQESTIYHNLEEAVTRSQIVDYANHKSDNLKISAEMFGVDTFSGTLNESGTHIILHAGEITAHVPVEHVINMQYSDLLSLNRRKR